MRGASSTPGKGLEEGGLAYRKGGIEPQESVTSRKTIDSFVANDKI